MSKQGSFSFLLNSSFLSSESNSSINKLHNKRLFSNCIFEAVKNNNIHELNRLFIQINNVSVFNRPNKLLHTPLILAISMNRLDCVKTLIEIGVDVNKTDELENTPLHIACIDCNYEVANLLLEQSNVNIELLNAFNESPLLSACESNNVPCVKLLLEKKAYPHKRNNNGNNAIHIACQYGNIEIIELLLNRGVSINYRNSYGKTPLYIACIEKQLRCVEFLLKNGADINIPDNIGRTPINACYDSKIKQLLRKF
jgi:ankyrin repeat protein